MSANARKSSGITSKNPYRRLARMHCIQECISKYKDWEKFPESLCYVPSKLEYTRYGSRALALYGQPSKTSKLVRLIRPPAVWLPKKLSKQKADIDIIDKLITGGEEFYNSEGIWVRLFEYIACEEDKDVFEEETWLLVYDHDNKEECAVRVKDKSESKFPYLKKTYLDTWQNVIEHKYSITKPSNVDVIPLDDTAVKELRDPPVGWSKKYDSEMVKFLVDFGEPDSDIVGPLKSFIEDIDVSSSTNEDDVKNLLDGDLTTFWESDGSQHSHWIRIKLRKNVIVKRLYIVVDYGDGNYMPYHVVTSGGPTAELLEQLSETYITSDLAESKEICVCEGLTKYYQYLQICVKENLGDGIDCRIHGIKIKSADERDIGYLHVDLFSTANLTRYPKLQGYSKDSLYRRSLVLNRFISCLDLVLPYMYPKWETFSDCIEGIQVVKHLIPLSKKRNAIINNMLKTTESERPENPTLSINRRSAREHRLNPDFDDLSKTVFNQIYEGLKNLNFDYRWQIRYNLWWTCRFLCEGIIDQGGGFRDSLSDISEELCPSDPDAPLPLPYFIRTKNDDDQSSCDLYVPNPACKDFEKYFWIGQLMGACFRGKESLVLSLPQYVWKVLASEAVTWDDDYSSVDAVKVRLINNIEKMDEDMFNVHYGEVLTWSAALSGGTVVHLKDDGASMAVSYSDRVEYCEKVKRVRLDEFNEQIDAIRRGLSTVVPAPVFELLTWYELEKRIAGDPEISIPALEKYVHLYDLETSDTRVNYLWEALKNFSNEDRSRFIRFITGRKRLPAPIDICSGECDSMPMDGLPTSSTCSNTMYLPMYSSAKLCEEKIRYAIYNCVAIDSDTTSGSWEVWDAGIADSY